MSERIREWGDGEFFGNGTGGSHYMSDMPTAQAENEFRQFAHNQDSIVLPETYRILPHD